MLDIVADCKLIGKQLETAIAGILCGHGYVVYQDLYVPYFPGSDSYTEVDIVAISPEGKVLTVECKNMGGVLVGGRYDRKWELRSFRGTCKVANAFRQSYSHWKALVDNLHVDVVDIVVLSNRTGYIGDADPRLASVFMFEQRLHSLMSGRPAQQLPADIYTKLSAWANSPAEVKQRHVLSVNRVKNRDIMEQAAQSICQEVYCVIINDKDFFSFTDDAGMPHKTEKLEEAAFFDQAYDAFSVAGGIVDAEVCTFERGTLELFSDLPDDMDDLTPEEYAYEIGARPW